MGQRLFIGFLLASFLLAQTGCYTLKTYKPEEVKPEWEISYVIKTNQDTVRFDDEDQGVLKGKTVVGCVRNYMSELRPRRVPVDSISTLYVRRPDTSGKGLLIAGIGVGIAAFVTIMVINQHNSKATPGVAGSSGVE